MVSQVLLEAHNVEGDMDVSSSAADITLIIKQASQFNIDVPW